jgi:hypothetical protein
MITLQEVLEKFYDAFKMKYNPSPIQAKAVYDIMQCRTPALGGHIYECEECGHSMVLYNSCRNRHCNICQGLQRAVWVDKRTEDILDAPYFHVVFTLPKELHSLIYQNQRQLYKLMYKAVSETLSELSRDTKYIGAQIGFMSLIHTWTQDLNYHPHIHTVVLAGGLTDTNKWRKSSKKFFIPVKVLSKKFRGKYLHYLKQYYHEGLLSFFGNLKEYENPENFANLVDRCYRKEWYTYTKKTFSGPLAVIKYLGRYTHRVAVSNERILSMDDETVTISVGGSKNKDKQKTVTMSGVEFIRRFLMHVLPKGFVKIRHYGLLANRNKKTKLELCRNLTGSPVYIPKFKGLKTIEILSAIKGKDVTLCPCCSLGKMKIVKTLMPKASP